MRPRRLKRATSQAPPGGILLASEGRPITTVAVDKATELARQTNGAVHVFAVARVYGVSFALPSPWLRPNRQEWQAQRESVEGAIRLLETRGLQADGNILGTRKATKRIVGEAKRLGCEAIVMGADPPRNRVLGDFMWSQEPYRVRRRARIPVHLVVDEGAEPRR
jgi:nucleotide-binding universal stress UspA family protein